MYSIFLVLLSKLCFIGQVQMNYRDFTWSWVLGQKQQCLQQYSLRNLFVVSSQTVMHEQLLKLPDVLNLKKIFRNCIMLSIIKVKLKKSKSQSQAVLYELLKLRKVLCLIIPNSFYNSIPCLYDIKIKYKYYKLLFVLKLSDNISTNI